MGPRQRKPQQQQQQQHNHTGGVGPESAIPPHPPPPPHTPADAADATTTTPSSSLNPGVWGQEAVPHVSPVAEALSALGVFIATGWVYCATAHRSAAGGDAGELSVVSHTLGVAHPPGYPTMTLVTFAAERVFYDMLWAVLRIAPAGVGGGADMQEIHRMAPPGLVQNWTHALIGAGANAFLCMAVLRLVGSPGIAVAASLVYGFSTLVWQYSTHVEVFALNNLLLNIVIFLCVEFFRSFPARSTGGSGGSDDHPKGYGVLYAGAFFSGLALTNQHTSVLFVAPFILWVATSDFRRIFLSEGRGLRAAKLSAAFTLGIAPYAYLPLCKLYLPNANSWGETETFDGFLTHFLRREYGTFSLASQEAEYRISDFQKVWHAYLTDIYTQVGPLVALLAPAALYALYAGLWAGVPAPSAERGSDARVWVPPDTLFLATLLLYLNVFHALSNLPIDKPLFFGVQQRFWIQPLSLTAVLMARGMSLLAEAISRVSRSSGAPGGGSTHLRHAMHMAVAVCVSALAIASASERYPTMDQSGNFIVRDYGRAILDPLPKNALVLTKGDIMINSARYVQELDGVRRDIRLVDQEMMTYHWYVTSLRKVYPDVSFPGGCYHPMKEGCFSIAQLFAANRKRRVFLAHGFKDGDRSWQGKYSTLPYGVIHEVVTVRQAGDRSMGALRRYIRSQRGAIPMPADTALFNATALAAMFPHPHPQRKEKEKEKRFLARPLWTSGGLNWTMQLPERERYADHTWERVVEGDYWMAHHNVAYVLLDWYSKAAAGGGQDAGRDTPQYVALLEANQRLAFLVDANRLPRGMAHRNHGVTLQGLLRYDPSDLQLMKRLVRVLEEYIVIQETEVEAKMRDPLEGIRDAVRQYRSHLKAYGEGGR